MTFWKYVNLFALALFVTYSNLELRLPFDLLHLLELLFGADIPGDESIEPIISLLALLNNFRSCLHKYK